MIAPAALLGLLGFLTPPGALVKFPDAAALVQAAASNDDVELERVAVRLGPARLMQLAEKSDQATRLAALHGIPLIDDAWALLPRLPALFSDGDEEISRAAGLAARRIAEAMTPELYDHDMPRDVPANAARALLQAALDENLRTALRVESLDSLAALRAVTKIDDKRIEALLASDKDAAVRRAAGEALAGTASATADAALFSAIANDRDAGVAAAAAATLCRDAPASGGAKPGPVEKRIEKLPAAARKRLRDLALDDNAALADRIDMLPCLRVAMQPDDQKALDALARRPPDSLRRRARSLGGR